MPSPPTGPAPLAPQAPIRAAMRWDIAALVAVFVLIYGVLLYRTDGVPFVVDNNESFSALVHGSNLYHFGLSRSYGLTDEAYGADPAAHPYVYTHQGNFPRIFSFLLYAAGIRSVEAQIAVTTFTVGLGTILLVYLFFSRLAGRSYGAIAAALLMSDYMLSMQWIVNTFKVWHGFLLFALLGALQAYFAAPRARWLVLAAAAAACVAYFDLLVGVFTFALAALYVVAEARASGGRRSLAALMALGAGGAFSVTLFLVQLIGYYGIEGLKQDLYLTFMGRNYAASDPAVIEQWRSFFVGNRIVFWEMLVDSSIYTGLNALVKSVFTFGFSIMTPYFAFLVLALVLGKLLCLVADRLDRHHRPAASAASRSRWPQLGAEWLAWMSAHLLAALIVLGSLLEIAAHGNLISRVGELVILGAAAALSLAFVALLRDARRANVSRLLIVAVYCLCLMILLVRHEDLYHVQRGDPQLVWEYILIPWVASGALKLFALLAVACGAWWILRGEQSRGDSGALDADRQLAILKFAALSAVAFVAAYYFSPGYMHAINLQRFAPVLVFVLLPVVALAFWCALNEARRLATPMILDRAKRAPLILGSLSALVFIHMAVFWVWLQKSYLEIAPPSGAEVFKMLDKPPYRGASFVVSSYGAPVAAKTGSWAYVDTQFFVNARYAVDELGYRPDGSDLYLWFADRGNAKYRNPEYALCFHMYPEFWYPLRVLTLRRAAKRLGATLEDIFSPTESLRAAMLVLMRRPAGCGAIPLVSDAMAGNVDGLSASIVARDPSLVDRWAIVRLEDDFPPFLAPLGAGATGHVRTELKRSSGRCYVRTHFEYRQQQGKKDAGSTMSAWLAAVPGRERKQIYAGPAKERLELPPRTSGQLMISITPRTSTRTGRTYLSQPLELQGC